MAAEVAEQGPGSLDGTAAVVTGGASGIGLRTAHRLARAGARVVVVDVDGPGAAAAAAEVGGIAVEADVADPPAWERVVDAARRLGPLRVVHLNAGATTGQEQLTTVSVDDYRRIMGVNVDGVVFGIRATLADLRRCGHGAVVVTSSMAALVPFPGDPLYTLTKTALVGLVRALAPTLQRDGVTINAVCPSLVDTPMIDGEVRDVLVGSGFPLVSPEAVADAVMTCVEGDVNGQVLVVQADSPPQRYRFAPVPAAAGGKAAAAAVPDRWRDLDAPGPSPVPPRPGDRGR